MFTRLVLRSTVLSVTCLILSGCSLGGITLFADNDPGLILAPGESANTHFFTREMNHNSGIALVAGSRYTLDATILSNWIDGDIVNNELDQPLNEKGFSNSLMAYDWIGLTRRSREHNWFELMLKQQGCKGTQGITDLEYIETEGLYRFTAGCSGKLQLFVNDSLGFYSNNAGYANITISRLD